MTTQIRILISHVRDVDETRVLKHLYVAHECEYPYRQDSLRDEICFRDIMTSASGKLKLWGNLLRSLSTIAAGANG